MFLDPATRIRGIAPYSGELAMSQELLQETIGDELGLKTCIPLASDTLGLSDDQIVAFCEATPNGETLWKKFRAQRNSPDTPADYDFMTFMVEVLAKTDHPVSQ